MAKATTTIRQMLNSRPDVQSYFAANQALFNRGAAFYFDVIQAHLRILDLSNKEAVHALEKLTHATKLNPHPVMPLASVQENILAMFRRAAIASALGSARSFYGNLSGFHRRKEKAEAKGPTLRPLRDRLPGKASNSSSDREGRAIFRCCHPPRCRPWEGTIHSSRWAWGSQRAWHRSEQSPKDGWACSRYHQPTTPPKEPELRSNCSGKRRRWGVRSCWALAHAECHLYII